MLREFIASTLARAMRPGGNHVDQRGVVVHGDLAGRDLIVNSRPAVEDVGMMRAAGETRIGDWMEVHSGRRFYPLDPRPEEVDADDVAHSLSRQNRYGGHIDLEHYSVAEHSVLMSWRMLKVYGDSRLAFEALLHDAPEAYISDMVRPLKRNMPEFVQHEAVLWARGIARRWPTLLPAHIGHLDDRVKDADNRILVDERAQVMRKSDNPWGIDHLEPLDVRVRGWAPDRAKEEWLLQYHFLLENLGRADLA